MHYYQMYTEQILSYWSGEPKRTAWFLIQKYGLPQEVTVNRLIWHENGPWKRTVLHRKTVPHHFPMFHEDYLEQTVNYKVPPVLFDEIAKYDGSIYLDRTGGEASAKCDKEEMNFLALNLLHDIVIGTRKVEDARLFYAETAKNYLMNKISSPYVERLLFDPQKYTADPDSPI